MNKSEMKCVTIGAEPLTIAIEPADIRLRLDHDVEACKFRAVADEACSIHAHVCPRSLLVRLAPDRVDDQLFRKPVAGRVAVKHEVRPPGT